MYHGDGCPLYQDLLEWCDELKGASVLNERFDFSPTYLRRTLWKMMVEVDRFYEQECTPEMFEPGYGKIPWPTPTKLSLLLSKFLDGDEMKSRSFPEEWSADFYRKKKLLPNAGGYQGRGGGSYQGGGGGRQGRGGGGYQGGGGQR
jgi:uncharacterized membrane protein YgcG